MHGVFSGGRFAVLPGIEMIMPVPVKPGNSNALPVIYQLFSSVCDGVHHLVRPP